MKRSIQILALVSIVILSSSVAWAQFGPSGPNGGANGQPYFNDADGDGLCDFCGEECLYDGDGDGLCDRCGAPNGNGPSANGPNGNGPGDGTGNQGEGPMDGTGYGAGPSRGTGDCDGTGASRDRGTLKNGQTRRGRQ